MERDDGLRLLAKSGWLSRTPADFRDARLSSSRWRRQEAGALLTLGGDDAADVIGLASGVVEFSTVFWASDTPILTLGHAVSLDGLRPVHVGSAEADHCRRPNRGLCRQHLACLHPYHPGA